MNYEIRIAGTDVRFPCRANQTILDAALSAAIDIPYSCRKGVCGSCAGSIASGDITHAPPPMPLGLDQQLFCQCMPRSDLTIRPLTWRRVDPDARKTFLVKVVRSMKAAPDIHLLHLRLPAGKRARFRAGQYLQVLLPDGSRRAYSMANPPHESDILQLHVRHVEGGQFTARLQTLAVGDMLEVELPFGDVVLPEAAAPSPLLCIAAGTGFAPIKSLLDDLAKKADIRPITLMWAARDKTGLYLLPAVDNWRKQWSAFEFIPVVEHGADARELGAICARADIALASHFNDLSNHDVYCCGSPPMVNAVRAACASKGLQGSRFYCDVFVPGPAA